MTDVVIDASAALAWTLKTQRTTAALTFLDRSDDLQFIAPFIFYWEAQNVLLRLRNKGLLVNIDYAEATAGLKKFDIRLEQPFDAEQVEPLAYRENLSLFDAAYVSLALERRLSLASRDAGMLRAADRLGVHALDLR